MDRRRTAALFVAWMAVAPVRAGESLDAFTVTEIAPGNFVHYGRIEERSPDNLGDQANIGFIVGEQCVAVIDPGGSLPVGRALRAAIRRITDKPVCWVILTHMHPDHIFGAAAFRDDRAVIVGHENLPRSMGQRARPYLNALKRDLGDMAAGSEAIPPTRLVRDETVLDLGGRSLLLKAWPVAHTDNDVTVFDESTGTLWLGDLLFVRHTPVVDGQITGFIDVLDQLATLSVARFVPGHGKTDARWPQVLQPERDYLALIVRETRAAIKRRKTIEEAVDEVGLTERDKWVNFDDYHRRNVTTAYTELEWE
jgi:quinoprotein relay system zinc metallohydrolase 2